MKYIEVNSIEEASHWMSLENNKVFTFGKLYKLKLRIRYIINTWGENIKEEEYWIKDNNDKWCTPFSGHNGIFVKVLI